MDGVVLDMVISTDRIPPRQILCKREDSETVVCYITDRATNRRVAEFKISNELVPNIPDLIKLYT